MRVLAWCGLLLVVGALACGGTDGDSAGSTLSMQSAYTLSCAIDPLVLDIPIELSYELDRPYRLGRTSELSFSAVVVFSEQTSSALIGAGVSKIDIISLRVATSLRGAAPPLLGATLMAAPINDFDLATDTDDNGLPGPHRFGLGPVAVTSAAAEGATEVELGLSLDQISLVLGDSDVPADCAGPSLVGPSVRYPVEP